MYGHIEESARHSGGGARNAPCCSRKFGPSAAHGPRSPALGIDQTARLERNPLVLNKTSVLASDFHAAVCQQRDVQTRAEATCGAGLLRRGMVGVLPVRRDGSILRA